MPNRVKTAYKHPRNGFCIFFKAPQITEIFTLINVLISVNYLYKYAIFRTFWYKHGNMVVCLYVHSSPDGNLRPPRNQWQA